MVARYEETPSALSSGEAVATKLCRIAEKARKEPSFKFTSLYHLMNEEHLRGCFQRLRKNAAAGIDNVTKEMYAENLDSNLVEGLHRMAYRPQPVRRKYIPKPGSDKQRPLGIPCVEDKLVQAGLVRILEAVYEQGLHRRFLWIPPPPQLPPGAQSPERHGGEQSGESHC